jgi:hypothetical protein
MCHMSGEREVFESFLEYDSEMHVELGMGIKHEGKVSGTVSLQLESEGTLRVTNLLWVP